MNQVYIYESIDKEAERLRILNQIYNKNTLSQLEKLITPNSQVLEIGPGVGFLGIDIIKILSDPSQYTGLDQDQQQIARAKDNFLKNDLQTNSLITGSVCNITTIKELQGKKFDIIFCRWVIAHIPPHLIHETIQTLYKLLNPNGFLVCEEGDVSTVKIINRNQLNESVSTKAFDKWYDFSFALENIFKIDLRIGAKIDVIIANATQKQITKHFFQPKLKTIEEKTMLSYAIASTLHIRHYIESQNADFFNKFGIMEQLESDLIQLANDQTIQIDYIKNNLAYVKNDSGRI